MIEIDLLTKIVAPQTRVWRSFAGDGYRFLDKFIQDNVIFLDLPSLELPDGPLSQHPELLPRIVAAKETIEVYRQLGPEAEIKVDWRDHMDARNTIARGLLRQSVINMFEHARKDDLVVAPATVSDGLMYVGVLTEPPAVRRFVTVERYGATRIPARGIEWLGSISEHKLSIPLISSLRHQNPFSLLERSLFPEVLSVAYTNFVFGDRHCCTIFNEADDYLDRDAALLGLISQVSGALAFAIETKAASDNVDLVSLFLASIPIEYSCSQSVDIHSAGFNRYISSKLTPLMVASIVGALIYLGSNFPPEAIAGQLKEISVVNSPAADHDCIPPVSEATKRFLQTTPIEEVQRMCILARDAHARAGLKPGVAVKGGKAPRPEKR
ncbi:hypothetical protein [Bradyrhizobium sp. USDA 3458]|uniref:hypothetical protein n=1 Tax=Bradyrhizobium sp. USDA 3458 TaxID=2591461 RepID=UPI001141479D|nr:hypothetical protein [Bradyrhizobium sp. USDA 3458]